jgi:hypothetical protein
LIRPVFWYPAWSPANQDDLLTLITYADETAEITLPWAQRFKPFICCRPTIRYNPQIEQYYWEDAPGRDARTLNAYVRANLVSRRARRGTTAPERGAEVTALGRRQP